MDIEHWALGIWYIRQWKRQSEGNADNGHWALGIGHWASGLGVNLGLGIDCNGQAAAVTRGALRFVFRFPAAHRPRDSYCWALGHIVHCTGATRLTKAHTGRGRLNGRP